MKKLKLIYNPQSGDTSFKSNLDICIEIFQKADYEVHLFRSSKKGDIENHVSYIGLAMPNFYDAIVISGGDGSINILINAIMKNNLAHIPLGIIPSGTANDFASFLKIPKDIKEACNIITNENITPVDVGLCNEKYFINVCAGGIFANVSETMDKNFKETFGKFAYYLKGIEKMHNHTPTRYKITNSKETIIDDFDLFLILNSSGTAGIEMISPEASISDGYFDFVGFKSVVGLTTLPKFLIKFLRGEYLDDSQILFFKDNNITIENLSSDEIFSDLDGEKGTLLPINVINIKHAIKLFTN
ncbi:MAG: YegS/Rv2252/BmrU family lipid kinase [bacterium]